MAEWLKALVSKTGGGIILPASSNLAVSVERIFMKRYPCGLSKYEWYSIMDKTKELDDLYYRYIRDYKPTIIERIFVL